MEKNTFGDETGRSKHDFTEICEASFTSLFFKESSRVYAWSRLFGVMAKTRFYCMSTRCVPVFQQTVARPSKCNLSIANISENTCGIHCPR